MRVFIQNSVSTFVRLIVTDYEPILYISSTLLLLDFSKLRLCEAEGAGRDALNFLGPDNIQKKYLQKKHKY